jgi:glycosidase
MDELRSVADLDLPALARRPHHPSPAAWEDQVLYFLLVDRFSDGKELGTRDAEGRAAAGGTTPPFTAGDEGNAVRSDAEAAAWRDAGGKFCGGTLAGARSKLGYLQRLGVTALWVSPVFKQVRFGDPYHGYAIQDFLQIEPRFGSREDLVALVEEAHRLGMYVILDVVLNHAGDVFAYDPDRHPTQAADGSWYLDPRWDTRPYRVAGWRGADGGTPWPSAELGPAPHAWPDGAVWPAELQAQAAFSRLGRISNWDYDPEYLQGDFCGLKDVRLGDGPPDDFVPSPALRALCDAYRFWIGHADVDGFRVDTVKHMGAGPARFLASVLHEWAQELGKERFLLVGEIAGTREQAYDTLETSGLDAALGIAEVPEKLEGLVKGTRPPAEYFDLFRNSLQVRRDSHAWFRDKVVTMYDDHDQIRRGEQKARFCAGGGDARRLAFAALAANATTLGIPCIYYGSEQELDGAGGNDRYIREAMFGGSFGAFRSRERHVFDEGGRTYRALAELLAVRRASLPLRRGRQYLRAISGDGASFGLPQAPGGGPIRSVLAWSRLFGEHEVVVAVNNDPAAARTAWVTVDARLQAARPAFTYRHSSDAAAIGRPARVEARNGRAVEVTVPPAGVVVLE